MATTLVQRFQASVHENADRTAIRHRTAQGWEAISYAELGERVRNAALGLRELGVQPGDRVALLSSNRWEWTVADWAILHAGAVTVPVYETITPDQQRYILRDAGAKVLIAETLADLAPLLEAPDAMGEVEQLLLIEPDPKAPEEVTTLEALMAAGRAASAEEQEALESTWRAVEPGDLATLIYTSGTTGDPKGVMLTHGNITSNIEAGLEVLPLTAGEEYLSFLPLAHSFERVLGHFAAYWVGVTVWIARDIDTLGEDLRACRPTLLLAVPRLYEKMRDRVLDEVRGASPLRQALFDWATKVGREHFEHVVDHQPAPLSLALRHWLADKLVLSRVREAMGLDRMRFGGSGAAAIEPEVLRFFGSLGLLLLEGYGLTEASPVISFNRPGAVRLGSVGEPLPGVEVRIDEAGWNGPEGEGELLARGPSIMQGYWDKPHDTHGALDEGGWLHTGDVARQDEEGYLYITDRKKALFKTAYGKYVAPQHVETLLQGDRLVDMAVAIGAERKYVAALLVPDLEALLAWANRQEDLTFEDREALLAHDQVQARFQKAVDHANAQLARHEQVKRFALLPEAFEVGEELTPTLKVKRRVIEEQHAELIAKLYPDDDQRAGLQGKKA